MSIANRVHITKRTGASGGAQLASRLAAIVVALAASGLVMLFMGYHPLEIFGKIITSSLSTYSRFGETMNKTILLTMLSLGISVAFRMKFWNIGAEGQFYMGAFGAALIKAKFTTSETLVTLMMNYIAISFISYLQYGPWKDPESLGAAKIARFSDNAILPKVFGIHAGWIIMLALVVVMTILLKYTKLGYQIDVLGESETTARYAGMNTLKIMIIAVLLSGGLCGRRPRLAAFCIRRRRTSPVGCRLCRFSEFRGDASSWPEKARDWRRR